RRLPLQIQGVGRRLDCWFEDGDASAGAVEATNSTDDQLELVVLGAARDASRLEEAFAAL
ncbi:MAG: cobalamin biosynthesis protein CobW, partial [Cyanobium sp.]